MSSTSLAPTMTGNKAGLSPVMITGLVLCPILFLALVAGFWVVSRKGKNCCFPTRSDRLDVEARPGGHYITEQASAHRGGRGATNNTRARSCWPLLSLPLPSSFSSACCSQPLKAQTNSPTLMMDRVPTWEMLPITRIISSLDPGVFPATSSYLPPALPTVPPDVHLSQETLWSK